MVENKSGKRIIAIAVSPRAYDEILTLKSERTWTQWLLELMSIENPMDEVIADELLELVKPKTKKPPAEEIGEAISATLATMAEAGVEIIPSTKVEPRLKKAKKVEAKPGAKPKVEFGKVDPITGGVPVDIGKIGKHEAAEVGV